MGEWQGRRDCQSQTFRRRFTLIAADQEKSKTLPRINTDRTDQERAGAYH
jgi:hypothetical protein